MIGQQVITPPVSAGIATPFSIAADQMRQARAEGIVGGSELRLPDEISQYLDTHPQRLTGVTIDVTITAAPEPRESATKKRRRKSDNVEVPSIYFVIPYSTPTATGGTVEGRVLCPVEPEKVEKLAINSPAKLVCKWNEKRVINGSPSPGYDINLKF